MKSILTLIVAVMMASSMFAQAPNKMSYQAVIRNSSNALVANKVVGIKISILQSTSTGAEVFVETHTPQTNANGLATLEIGGGSVVSGSFAGIDWSKGPYFIKTETDPTGGTAYTISGVSQVLSVPYALQSATANALSTSATGVVRSVNGKGGNLFLKGAGGTTINNNGDTINISSSGGSGGTGIQGVQSTDGIVRISNPNGPIATLNINDGSIPAEKLAAGVIPTSAGGDLSGTYPNPLVVKLQGRPMTNTLPTSGQSLAWNGTAWAPSTVSSGWSLTGNTGSIPAVNFLGTIDNKPMLFKTNNIERLRIDTLGHVGIGATSIPSDLLQISGKYSSLRLLDTDDSTVLVIAAPNPTDGATGGIGTEKNDLALFTDGIDRMTIKVDGKVGIGTTDPADALQLGSYLIGQNHYLSIKTSGGNLYKSGIKLRHYADDDGFTIESDETVNQLRFIRHAGTPSTAMAIDRINGNVGIGTTTSDTKLTVKASSVNEDVISVNGTSGKNVANLGQVGNDGSLRLLDSQGNTQVSLLGGAGSTSYFTGNVGIGFPGYSDHALALRKNMLIGYVCRIENSGNSNTANVLTLWGGVVNGNGGNFIQFVNYPSSTEHGRIQLVPTGVSYVTTSDMRLKKNIGETNTGLEVLKKIRVKDYEFTDRAQGQQVQGILAQELYEVYPQAVCTGTDEVDKNGKLMQPWGIDYGKLTPLLVKSVQEQQAQIQSKDKSIMELQNQLREMQQRMDALAAQMHALTVKIATEIPVVR